MTTNKIWDCIIVGGGPAGLTAAIYLARYRRNVLLFDNKNSRAQRIPCSNNYPGFPDGISGKNFLEKLYKQLSKYKVPIFNETVVSLQLSDKNRYKIVTENAKYFQGKKIILCTGVKDIEPQLGNINDAINKGLVRHCPVCDAYEVIDKNIAVIGEGKKGLEEALFLRDYSSNITLLTLGKITPWTLKDIKNINKAGIKIINENILKINLSYNHADIIFSNSLSLQFDCIYSALGSINNNKLANDVHANQKKGLLIVNKKQQTSIPGLYAAGDIVSGLNQISVATSQAAIAATSIHKALSKN